MKNRSIVSIFAQTNEIDMETIPQRVFQILEVRYKHPRRYPVFKVYWIQLKIASSLPLAEDYLAKYVHDPGNREDVYVFYIREVPVDVPAPGVQCLSERVYGPDGQLIDFRDFSSVDEVPGVFEGRTPERIRFKQGDIVEVLGMDEVELAYVAGGPVSHEEAARINSEAIITLDVTDDSYTVFLGPTFSFHQHIDALCVFKPHFKVPGPMLRRIEKSKECWNRRINGQ